MSQPYLPKGKNSSLQGAGPPPSMLQKGEIWRGKTIPHAAPGLERVLLKKVREPRNTHGR